MKFDKWLLFTILITIALTLFEYYPAIFQGYYISGDNRIQMFPLHRFYDKTLFPDWDLCNDILFRYLPFGFTAICVILSKFMSLYTITLVLPFLLSLVTVVFVYKIGTLLTKSNGIGFLTAFLFLLLYLSSDLGRGGTLRAFGFLFIAAFLYYLLKGERIKAYLIVIISWWFHPITIGIFLFAVFFDLILALINNKTEKALKKKLVVCFTVFLILLVISLIPMLRINALSPISNNPVRQYSQKEVEAMPEFGPQGAAEPSNRLIKDKKYILSPSFINDQLLYIENYQWRRANNIWLLILGVILMLAFILKRIHIRKVKLASKEDLLIFFSVVLIMVGTLTVYTNITNAYGSTIWCLLLLMVVMIAIYGRTALKLPSPVWSLLAAALSMFVILYVVPHEISAGLHYPARQMGLVLPVFLTIFCLYNISKFISAKGKSRLGRMCLIPALFFFICYVVNYDSYLFHAKDKKLYEYLSSLSKEAVIGGHPYHMDFIPFFAKREVLTCNEIAPCWGPDIWPMHKERTYDVFGALYSHSIDGFRNFCLKYKDKDVFFAVDRYYLSQDYLGLDRLYFQPFDTYLCKITDNKNFFFLNLPDDRKVFDDGRVFVVKCSDFL